MKSMFTQLCEYLSTKKDALRIRDEQFTTESEGGRIEPGGWSETESGIHAMDFFYTGVLYFERLPAASMALLMLLITTWLSENDTGRVYRSLAWPRVDFIELGSGLLDLVIEIEFADMFYLGADPDGLIEINGQTYSVDAYELAVAETGKVNGGPTDV